MLNRRDILALAALAGITPAVARAEGETAKTVRASFGQPAPFSRAQLLEEVRGLARDAFVAPKQVPKAWRDLTYDQYKALSYRHTSAVWRDTPTPANLEFFAPGLYFPEPISVFVVEGGEQRMVQFDLGLFDIFSSTFPDLPNDEDLGFSGFRLKADIEGAGHKSEFAVFQGASYFRAIGKGQTYGLSARGLAIDTAEPAGEEFPAFRRFYIERPAEGAKATTVHAVLDSPSVAGLYSFVIRPGDTTRMDIDAALFPRRALDHVGIAAGTSMFLFDETNRERFDDFRPAVHDSDGLLIDNGAGERLWRQLANPKELQISSFVDENPRGFGLTQRPREFEDFADLEANYHARPSLWVRPAGSWGKGAVTLVEIPADKEIYDNIVAYWRPREPLEPGRRHDFTYSLDWGDAPAAPSDLARVARTRMGKSFSGKELAAVDYVWPEGSRGETFEPDDVTVHVSSNGAPVSPPIVQKNPATGGLRVAFTFEPEERGAVELRAQILADGKPATEVWLYRWTA